MVSLKYFFDSLEKLDDLKPLLPGLLAEFFKLMNEVGMVSCILQHHYLSYLATKKC